MTAGPGLAVPPKRPDRKIRARICELYQHYAVLFAALLKPTVDEDYQERIEDLNQDVKDLNALSGQLDALAEGKDTLQSITAAAAHLEEEQLRQLLMMFLQHGKHKNKEANANRPRFKCRTIPTVLTNWPIANWLTRTCPYRAPI